MDTAVHWVSQLTHGTSATNTPTDCHPGISPYTKVQCALLAKKAAIIHITLRSFLFVDRPNWTLNGCGEGFEASGRSGAIYTHRIFDNRFTETSGWNFRMFHELCGGLVLKNAVLVTNMWSHTRFVKFERTNF